MSRLEELQKLVNEPSFVDEMKEVFFEAMSEGYAGNAQKGTISLLPGSKMIEYSQLPWGVIDTYLVTPLSLRSGGMTVIYYEDVPVWMMQYFGKYEEVAIPCLKAALRQAYSERHFVGGRGPAHFVHEGYVYENPKILPQDFQLFRGDEFVRKESGEVLGRHVYQGGTMC